jgi:hypothetical protein
MVSDAVFICEDPSSRLDLLKRGMHSQSLYRPACDMLRGGAEFRESLLAQRFGCLGAWEPHGPFVGEPKRKWCRNALHLFSSSRLPISLSVEYWELRPMTMILVQLQLKGD